jgi:hypothetical protein
MLDHRFAVGEQVGDDATSGSVTPIRGATCTNGACHSPDSDLWIFTTIVASTVKARSSNAILFKFQSSSDSCVCHRCARQKATSFETYPIRPAANSNSINPSYAHKDRQTRLRPLTVFSWLYSRHVGHQHGHGFRGNRKRSRHASQIQRFQINHLRSSDASVP